MIWVLIHWICLNWLWHWRKEYSIEIPSEDLTDLLTVGDVVEYLKTKGVEE